MNHIILRDGKKFVFDSTKIMGILNITPDSFYEGSRVATVDLALHRALEMIEEGADILDIGGESTRPGSEPISEDEEIERVIPIIEAIRKFNKEILISVDTYRAKTAEYSIKAGADIINDISAMTFDKDMAKVVKEYDVPVILMHIKGTPKNMQSNPYYDDVLKEVYEFLKERIEYAKSFGIEKEKIIIDPGIGFGKLLEHNIELIKNIDYFNKLSCPILLAHSRKSSIGAVLGNLPPKDRLEGTIAVSCFAALKGVDMIRVHDVKENKRALKMIEVLR
ncbi:dihydropteroate synthase [Caloramator quimbayensis]|uniref:Dihydropteroate synthase n=1 Tax=Caloramator quimbayensis TaxID=1147123 RepID=A0A1T4YF97_9CLOT|nr:dihydropteroate synthase [Caloramator quimbayensis]SKB00228.1 dihydropteroate synthase [Caloramator quimbayensis]